MRLFSFLIVALLLTGIVSYFTYTRLIDNPDRYSEEANNLSVSPTPEVNISDLPTPTDFYDQGSIKYDLRQVVRDLGREAQINDIYREFSIETRSGKYETVLGYKLTLQENSDGLLDSHPLKVESFFINNNFYKTEVEETEFNNNQHYGHYIIANINCFTNTYEIGEKIFFEVGCNSTK